MAAGGLCLRRIGESIGCPSKDVPRKLIQCDDDREQIECRGRFMLVVQCSDEFCCLRDERGIAVLNDGIERAPAPEPKAMSLSGGFGVMTTVLKPKCEDILSWKIHRRFHLPEVQDTVSNN